MDRNSRILISGAGIAGLTAALWLHRAGFRPTIVEKAPDIRVHGFIISLSHHSYHLAEEMGILDDLIELNNRVRNSSYHDRTGRPILKLDYDRLFDGVSIVQIMRDDLQNVLYDHARHCADYMFSNSIAKIEPAGEEVFVTFEDGQEGVYDLVIGADGLHSVVRELAFSKDEITEHFMGLHAAAFRCENLLDLTHKYEAYLEPQRHTAVYTTRTNELSAIFIWADKNPAVPPPGEARLSHLSDVYRGAIPQVRKLIDTRHPDHGIFMDALIQIEMKKWSKGRVVLVGDAAHSLTLLSGQGASIAFAGASALAKAIADMPADEALAHYENTIRPIISEVQPTVRKNARWYVPGGLGFHLLRDCTMRFLPNEIWIRYFKSKYSKA